MDDKETTEQNKKEVKVEKEPKPAAKEESRKDDAELDKGTVRLTIEPPVDSGQRTHPSRIL